MRECDKVMKLLSRYVDKETGEADTAFVKKHIYNCDICNEEYLDLFKLKQLMLEKERKSLPADYLVSRLKQEVADSQYSEEKPSLWIVGMGNLSRRLIPIPAVGIVLSLVFLILSSKQQVNKYSLDEHILSGEATTTETVVNLILGAQN